MKMFLNRATAVIALVLLSSFPALADGIFPDDYSAVVMFNGAELHGTSNGLAFDGASYWAVAGGYLGTNRNLAQYDLNGNLLSTYETGLNFRSVFTNVAGDVLAKEYNLYDETNDIDYPNKLYRMNTPGAFTPVQNSSFDDLLLGGTGAELQSGVVMNPDWTEYISLSGHDAAQDGILDYKVSRWDLEGNQTGFIALSGYGSDGRSVGETGYPQDSRIASGGGYILTYSDGILSAWDGSGNRVGTTLLIGGGLSTDSNGSLSYANGYLWINDRPGVNDEGGIWRGYDVFGDAHVSPTTSVPEPSSIVLLGCGLAVLVGGLRQKRGIQTS